MRSCAELNITANVFTHRDSHEDPIIYFDGHALPGDANQRRLRDQSWNQILKDSHMSGCQELVGTLYLTLPRGVHDGYLFFPSRQ